MSTTPSARATSSPPQPIHLSRDKCVRIDVDQKSSSNRNGFRIWSSYRNFPVERLVEEPDPKFWLSTSPSLRRSATASWRSGRWPISCPGPVTSSCVIRCRTTPTNCLLKDHGGEPADSVGSTTLSDWPPPSSAD